jgi:hypothetical protein
MSNQDSPYASSSFEGITLDENGVPQGFSAIPPKGPKGATVSVTSGPKLINRGGELTPETKLTLNSPITAPTFTTSAAGDIKNPHNRGTELACEQESYGKHSGKATHFLSNAADSDLISTPVALCQKHLRIAQQKNSADPNFTLTEIKPTDVEKHRSKLLAMKTGARLSLVSSLMTGGYKVQVPAGTPQPPSSVTVGKEELQWGKNTESFGVRGPALNKGAAAEATKRRTTEEQDTTVNAGLQRLRSSVASPEQHEAHMDFHEKNPNDVCPVCSKLDEDFTAKVEGAGVKAKGSSTYTGYSFNPKRPDGTSRVAKFGAPPEGAVTPEQPKRENPGTNEPNKTWQSVAYGDQQSLIENLPAHLTTYDQAAGNLRPLTPTERFVENRMETVEKPELRALKAGEDTAKKLRQRETLRSLPLADRIRAEAEIRRKRIGDSSRNSEFKAIEGPDRSS